MEPIIREENKIYEKIKENVLSELKKAFRPEFLNRVDDMIVFHRLTEEEIREICALMAESLKKRLAENEITAEFETSALELIAKEGFDPIYGARPLKRYLQSSVETLVARKILEGDLKAGSTIIVDVEDGELVCKTR